jgi:hypothetical protein
MTTTFKIYSAKQQGALSKGELIAVQSLETFLKYNGKWGVENYDSITILSNHRVKIEKICIEN